MKDYIIIGAGLSGLNIARKIKELELGSVLVLEKSRGIGGRMATRRTLETRFDHGAQFYRVKTDISEIHHLWKEEQISHQWFFSSRGNHWCARLGMTALAKRIALGLEIQLEKQIQKIEFENNYWKLTSDQNEEWFARHLIISAPLPQAIMLLQKSELIGAQEFPDLNKIIYTKALIGLVTLEREQIVNEHGYEEFLTGDFFSISDQKKKEVSTTPALTITMSAAFSEVNFEAADEIIKEKILKAVNHKYPTAKIVGFELKKWRYCQPLATYKDLFLEVKPKLYFIGDAFGGSSLIGAIRSSEALCEALI